MPEQDPFHDFKLPSPLRDTVGQLISEVAPQFNDELFRLQSVIKEELLSKKDEKSQPKYIQFEPVVPVDPRSCLENYKAWHYLVGSSWTSKVPPYEDLPGEDSIVSILKKLLQEKE